MADISTTCNRPVVSDTDKVDSRAVLDAITADSRAILFFHNSDINTESAFLEQSNEYINSINHTGLNFGWCNYSPFAREYFLDHEADEFRFCLIGKLAGSRFFSVKGVKDFDNTVKKL
ncbi:hypothetical protein IWW38_000020 [Coemansia aciculifera]|uniref:Uncharacterized protein n=1 Tax=Coemansia aciculifera TaxID=417176 RepID=A0ACC1MAF0_9FUNG|nr:hypothetical protein IWW38_000020 [Coemansia aciculifera]